MRQTKDDIISHTAPDGRQKLLTEHLLEVAARARAFAKPLQLENEAYIIALLHDIGKFHPSFQSYVRGGGNSTPHAAVGALWLHNMIPDQLYLPMVIAAHHRGLYDCNDIENIVCCNGKGDEDKLKAVLKIPQASEYLHWVKNTPEFSNVKNIEWHTWEGTVKARLLLSCLVDADHFETEKFFNGSRANVRAAIKHDSLDTIKARFHAHLKNFKAADNPVNAIRNDIQQKCLQAARGDGALFSLPAPTGAGKTNATMLFALEHAKARGKERIIFAMPFVAIIEQNAEIYKRAVNDDASGINNVVEHHSNVAAESKECKDGRKIVAYKNSLSAENWDAPIIVTTFVQFFESLFSHKTRHCKKLHNICNSVVVIDEMQALPMAVYAPVAKMIKELSERYNVSFLFSTATQLAMDELNLIEIAMPKEYFTALKRVQYQPLTAVDDTSALADKITRHNRVLCIVNSRQTCAALYDAVCEKAPNGAVFHLSTRMCRQHIMDKLDEIKASLSSPEESKPLYVISTSLVEAGVNLDFPVVYREGNGLDSIVQAAGRCNRDGKMDNHGQVYVFAPLNALRGELADKWHNADYVLKKYKHNPDSLEAIADYFKCQKEISKTDKHNIIRLSKETMLEKVSDKFNLIETRDEVDVIIPYKKGAELIAEIKQNGISKNLMRQLQRYVVSIPTKHATENMITHHQDLALLNNPAEAYSPVKGIQFPT